MQLKTAAFALMFRLVLTIALVSSSSIFARSIANFEYAKHSLRSTKRLDFPNFPNGFNPSIVKSSHGLILIFRWVPNNLQWHISHTCAVLLDDDLNPVGEPQVLNHRTPDNPVPSQAEDARIFSYKDELYIIYNDNMDVEHPVTRSLYIAKLNYRDEKFTLDEPLKLYHATHYQTRLIEKNWSPFEWDGHLLLSYTLAPHEVLKVNLTTGCCTPVFYTDSGFSWNWGGLRGGSAAEKLENSNEYFAFSHSWIYYTSPSSRNLSIPHYFAGAYTFDANPPFAIKRITYAPIICKGFYTDSNFGKRVIYPAGYAIVGNDLYLTYGKDDSQIWIATFAWNIFEKCLVPIETLDEIYFDSSVMDDEPSADNQDSECL